MATNPRGSQIIRHQFNGGWMTDLGDTFDGSPSGGLMAIPFLAAAENVEYELDGAPRKAAGTSKLNSSALESGASIMGLFDYWRYGSGNSPTQKRVIHVGTKIYKDDADGTFTEIGSGLTSGAIPHYTVFEDRLVIASDATGDVPQKWDQTTLSTLGTNTPNFAFSIAHKNRLWAAGVPGNMSRVYYSQALVDGSAGTGSDGDWNGSGAGHIDVDPDDGDEVVGLASYKGDVFVFKGRQHGSIHRISGSSPTGFEGAGDAGAFRLDPFVRGVGAAGQNSIFRLRDDIGFLTHDGVVQTLKATAAFGDFNEVALSRPIHNWIREHVHFGRLKFAWAANDEATGRLRLGLTIDAGSTNNAVLSMDYRFDPPRWAYLPMLSTLGAECLAMVIDPSSSSRKTMFAGGDDGFIRKLDQATRSIDGTTAYTGKAKSPFLSYGNPMMLKTLESVGIGIKPGGSYTLTFGWSRDDEAQQTTTVAQSGGAVLDSFVLGTDVLGGGAFVNRFIDLHEGGQFRTVQYEFSQAGDSQNLEVHNFTTSLHPDGVSLEN